MRGLSDLEVQAVSGGDAEGDAIMACLLIIIFTSVAILF
jgi:hypothetical protein